MGILTLKETDGYITEVTPDSEVQLSFDGTIAFCMSFMESACKKYLSDHPDDAESLYDCLDALFFRFMERAFPDVQPRDFELSDAGLLYAQDKIIEDAAKKGITYEEALKAYENKAKEYVRQKANKLA